MNVENAIAYENIILKPTQKIGIQYFEPVERYSVECGDHFHMMPEIMKFKKGRGRFVINQHEYVVTPKTLVYVPSMAVHALYLDESEKQTFLLQFETSVFTDLHLDEFYALGNRPLAIELSDIENERIDALMQWHIEVNEDLSQKALADGVMRIILLFVYDKIKVHGVREELFEQNKTMAKMYPLIKYLEDHKKFTISLEEAASMCGLSRFHFSRLFKSFFKTHFKDYLLRRKISAAITLLSGSELNITEIAYRCEFTDTAYFSQKFKEVLKKTPSEFRKSLLHTEEFNEESHG